MHACLKVHKLICFANVSLSVTFEFRVLIGEDLISVNVVGFFASDAVLLPKWLQNAIDSRIVFQRICG